MTELEQLIAEQRRDDTYRVHNVLSYDAWQFGVDFRPTRKVVTDQRHGKIHCYTILGCRCRKCKDVAARYKRDERASKRTVCSAGCGRTVSYLRGLCPSCAAKRRWQRRLA